MVREYILIAIVAASLLAGWRYGEMRYTAGADAVTAAYGAANAAAAEKEREDVKEVIKWKEKRVIVYRDRIKEVKVAVDPTGCLDTPLPDVGLGGMLPRPDNNPTRPIADNTGGQSRSD